MDSIHDSEIQTVMPAKAGIQALFWIPACAGMTCGFLGTPL
jgi:hypothetical protein